MLTKGVCLLHDNARPYTINPTKEMLGSFEYDVLNHPAHSPNLTLSDYYLFTSLKLHMGGKRFSIVEEIKEEVEKWTKGLVEIYFEEDIKKFITW